MDTQGSVMMKIDSKESKLEQMCPPRKRKCFREYLEGQDLKSEVKIENSAPKKRTDFGDDLNETCYLARLLHKSPNPAAENYDKIKDRISVSQGFPNKVNRVPNNNAWESFLREMYRANGKDQGTSNQLLNLYVKPTEDPMKYLSRKMVDNLRPDSNRASSNSDSVDSMTATISPSVREKLHGDSYSASSRTSTSAMVQNKPASSQQWDVIRSNNNRKPMPPLIHTAYLSENMAPRNNPKDTNALFVNGSTRGDALDLSLPKMKYSVENGVFCNPQDQNVEYNENYLSPKSNFVSNGDIPQPRLPPKLPYSQFTENENHNLPSKYHKKFDWSRNCNNPETCLCGKNQCIGLSKCDCRPESDMYQKNLSHKEEQNKYNSTGVSEQVRMTLSSFLQNSNKSVDQQNTQQQARKYSQMEEGNTGQVSLASMAEYFIEVALKRANKEKQF